MMPAMAVKKHVVVEQRTRDLIAYAETSPLNTIEDNGSRIGVIVSGTTHLYAHEALGNAVNYLKLGMVYPLPEQKIKDFAASVDTLWVIEELDPFIEEHCNNVGIRVKGKEYFSLLGEYTPAMIRTAVLGQLSPDYVALEEIIPNRPPVMCAGCPHRGTFYVLKKLGLTVSGDIGCYTLGAVAPLASVDTTICMGASIGAAFGMAKVQGADFNKKLVSVIGDSTFIHSGITGLIDIVYNKGISTVIVLDNSITGMTGHQNNPLNGKTIKGDPTTAVDLVSLAKAIGINRVRVVDPFDIKGTKAAVEEELQAEEPSLVISRRPCALLKSVKHEPALVVDQSKCVGCKACLKVGCPASSQKKQENGKTKAFIDPNQCLGCGVCVETCRLDAIIKNN